MSSFPPGATGVAGSSNFDPRMFVAWEMSTKSACLTRGSAQVQDDDGNPYLYEASSSSSPRPFPSRARAKNRFGPTNMISLHPLVLSFLLCGRGTTHSPIADGRVVVDDTSKANSRVNRDVVESAPPSWMVAVWSMAYRVEDVVSSVKPSNPRSRVNQPLEKGNV